jgi:hypothetical protein
LGQRVCSAEVSENPELHHRLALRGRLASVPGLSGIYGGRHNTGRYCFEAWHATLLTIAIMLFAIFFNTFLAVRLPFVEGCILILHLAGFFAVFIPMWVLSPRGKASDVLLNFENNGGWPTTGLSSMIGLTAPLTALIGYDCSVHMCKFAGSQE